MMADKKIIINYKNQKLKISYFLKSGKDKTFFYLHGLGCNKEDFKPILKSHEFEDYTIVGFDFPGHGNSSYPEKVQLDLNDLVEITDIVITKLKLKNIILIGHSMGGLIVLLYIGKFPKKAIGFVNVEGNLASEDCFFSHEVVGYSLDEFKNNIFPSIKKRVKEKKNKGFQIYSKHLQRINPKSYYDYCPTMTSYSDSGRLIDKFLQLKIPKIFIYGSENKKLSYLNRLKERINVIEIQHSNHWPIYDNPEFFYKTLAKFVNNIK